MNHSNNIAFFTIFSSAEYETGDGFNLVCWLRSQDCRELLVPNQGYCHTSVQANLGHIYKTAKCTKKLWFAPVSISIVHFARVIRGKWWLQLNPNCLKHVRPQQFYLTLSTEKIFMKVWHRYICILHFKIKACHKLEWANTFKIYKES